MIATSAAFANPFPGLRPFEPEEDYLFFGREQRVDELLTKLRRTHFLSVVGGSGSGKSSLVRAGLIPALYGGSMVGSGSRWRVAAFRPGEDPLGRMAKSLANCGLIDNVQANGGEKAMIEATLRRSSLGLVEAYQLGGLDARDNLLVLVDQFEELFRYRAAGNADYQDDAAAFVKLLLSAADEIDSRIYVALTMRSDFIGNCSDYPDLPRVVTRGQYLVPRMTRDEIREAIVGPISVAGDEIAPPLVVRLLNEAGEEPDQLPVLQHALMRTWDYWKRDHRPSEPIDIRHYEAIGTMAQALSIHADEAFAELLSDRPRTIAEKSFKALTEVDEQGRGVRRPTTLKAIGEIGGFDEQEVKQVLERFRQAGRAFLAPPPGIPLEGSTMLDLAHESLMRVWLRLQGWVAEEKQASDLYVRLSESAQRHSLGQQSLWRNPELSVAVQWLSATAPNAAWASRYRPGFEQAIGFLNRSRRAERKKRLLLRGSVAAATLIALTAVALYALLQRSENVRVKAENHQLQETTIRLQNQNKVLLERVSKQQTPKPEPPSGINLALVEGHAPELPSAATEALPKPPPVETPVAAAVKPTPTPPVALSAFANAMLSEHNTIRHIYKVPPLLWSSELAVKAQKFADTLAKTGEFKMEPGIQGILGQNIGEQGPPGTQPPASMVTAWAAEVDNYNYEKMSCIDPAKTCFHYTQVVWRDSKYVGCGIAHDAKWDIVVCDYDPPGNAQGERPF